MALIVPFEPVATVTFEVVTLEADRAVPKVTLEAETSVFALTASKVTSVDVTPVTTVAFEVVGREPAPQVNSNTPLETAALQEGKVPTLFTAFTEPVVALTFEAVLLSVVILEAVTELFPVTFGIETAVTVGFLIVVVAKELIAAAVV